MPIRDINPEILKQLKKHDLVEKFSKAKTLFEKDPKHPSLNTELLQPREYKIYSFRIDRKYRARFVVKSGVAEIINITLHYQ